VAYPSTAAREKALEKLREIRATLDPRPPSLSACKPISFSRNARIDCDFG